MSDDLKPVAGMRYIPGKDTPPGEEPLLGTKAIRLTGSGEHPWPVGQELPVGWVPDENDPMTFDARERAVEEERIRFYDEAQDALVEGAQESARRTESDVARALDLPTLGPEGPVGPQAPEPPGGLARFVSTLTGLVRGSFGADPRVPHTEFASETGVILPSAQTEAAEEDWSGLVDVARERGYLDVAARRDLGTWQRAVSELFRVLTDSYLRGLEAQLGPMTHSDVAGGLLQRDFGFVDITEGLHAPYKVECLDLRFKTLGTLSLRARPLTLDEPRRVELRWKSAADEIPLPALPVASLRAGDDGTWTWGNPRDGLLDKASFKSFLLELVRG